MKVGIKCIIGAVAALAVGFSTLSVPIPPVWHGTAAAFHIPLAINAFTACLHIIAVILFVNALSAYKAKLRHSYIAITTSIVLTALGTLQISIINGFNLWESAWVKHGNAGLPFLLAGLAMYIGTRNLGRLVGVQTLLNRALFVLPAAAILSALTAFLPHVAITTPTIPYAIANAVNAWGCLLTATAALIILRVRKHIGTHYVNAMTWLAMPLLVASVILCTVFVHGLVTVSSSDTLTVWFNVLGVIAGLLWIRAGYAFTQTKDY